jgi:transcriptional regulator with XRE-family HTH domain
VLKISSEREGFKLRLHQALQNRHYSIDRPTQLARDFNARFNGPSVTVHAVRKWLIGESIPTQDKMRTLAEWLRVSVEWLRYGNDDSVPTKVPASSSEYVTLVADLQLLNSHDQTLVREIVRILLRR